MATPEAQTNQPANDGLAPAGLTRPPATEQQYAAGSGVGRWFAEFERMEKAFFILGGVFVAAALMLYLGHRIGNDALFTAGVVVVSLALVGMASLFFPLNWIFLKGFLAWRRRRAAKRALDV